MHSEQESLKRGAFLAGAAWILEELDKRYPEWKLQEKTPELLEELAKNRHVQDDANQTETPQGKPLVILPS